MEAGWRDCSAHPVPDNRSASTLRHFTVATGYAAPEAAPDRPVPFYGEKIGHGILSEQHQIDEPR
jgi:hypothetical protein